MEQQTLFNEPLPNGSELNEIKLKKVGGLTLPITVIENYLNIKQIEVLTAEAQYYPFEKPIITVYGKQHPIPREQVWFADEGCEYLFSSIFIQARSWPKYVKKLKAKLQRELGFKSNGVLVNRYGNGNDSMGWHSDDEPEIQTKTDIVSVSIGSCRDFIIRHKVSQVQYKLALGSGDLLIMHWPMQNDWEHSLPKRTRVDKLRLNFTFRCLTPHFHR